MPGHERWTVRLRLSREGAEGEKAFFTEGGMTEERLVGTLGARTTPDGNPFPQAQRTDRFDAGLVAEAPISDKLTAHLRASEMTLKHRDVFGDVIENDWQGTVFTEGALSGNLSSAGQDVSSRGRRHPAMLT
jgi:iron complex outermembrane receptor protein